MSRDRVEAGAPPSDCDLSADYVAGYRRTHLQPPSYQYRLGYFPLLLADSLLRDYRLLDIGCGTGGYLRLLRNARDVVGLDASARMLTVARELLTDAPFHRLQLVHGTIETFEADIGFDLIRVGVYGSYEPFSVPLLRHLRSLLNPDGILLLALAGPRNPREALWSAIGLENRRMSPKRFERMLEQAELSFDLRTRFRRRDHYVTYPTPRAASHGDR